MKVRLNSGEHFNCVISCPRRDKYSYIWKTKNPLHGVADVERGFEMVSRVKVQPLLVFTLKGDVLARVFLDEVLSADRLMYFL